MVKPLRNNTIFVFNIIIDSISLIWNLVFEIESTNFFNFNEKKESISRKWEIIFLVLRFKDIVFQKRNFSRLWLIKRMYGLDLVNSSERIWKFLVTLIQNSLSFCYHPIKINFKNLSLNMMCNKRDFNIFFAINTYKINTRNND